MLSGNAAYCVELSGEDLSRSSFFGPLFFSFLFIIGLQWPTFVIFNLKPEGQVDGWMDSTCSTSGRTESADTSQWRRYARKPMQVQQ